MCQILYIYDDYMITRLIKMVAILDFDKKNPQGCQSVTRQIIDLDPEIPKSL